MTNSQGSQHRSDRIWLPSVLLVAQFLTISPVLLIVLANDEQRKASDAYLALLDGLDHLSFSISGSDHSTDPAYRVEMDRVRANPASMQIRDTLARVDVMVARHDARSALSELLDARRALQSRLLSSSTSMTRTTAYLKPLVSGACLLLFGVVLVIRKFRTDVAIQKKLESELRTANEEVVTALGAARVDAERKNQLLANVGRWIKMPLNVISDDADLAEAMTKIADQIVDYSQIESGALVLESVEFDPAAILTGVFEQFSVAAERKGLKLRTEIKKELSSLVQGDAVRLRQILVTLVNNAIRFTERGEIALRAEETSGVAGRTSLTFEVRDTGIEIPEHARAHVFDPGAQPGEVGRATEGTGLGLAISKKLVEMMGGKIEVTSPAGRGCSFWFTVVFESVERISERRGETREAMPEPKSSGIAIQTESVATLSTVPGMAKKRGRERRNEPRHGINYPTLLRSENAGIASVRILDVSTSGLRVATPFKLDVLSEVEIRVEGASVVGVVRNCTSIRTNEFHVGIELRPRSDNDQFLRHLSLLRHDR